MKIDISGIVVIGNPWRNASDGDDERNGLIHIGDLDLVDEIAEYCWGRPTKVFLNGEELANGDVVASTGYGYSEYTPLESDEVIIGDCDLLERLRALEGNFVHVLITDGKG